LVKTLPRMRSELSLFCTGKHAGRFKSTSPLQCLVWAGNSLSVLGVSMKKLFVMAFVAFSLSTARAEDVCIRFDGPSGQSDKAWGIQRDVEWNLPAPQLVPVIPSAALNGASSDQNLIPTKDVSFAHYTKGSNKNPPVKGAPQVNCWEDNCRMENVCGKIKSCNRNCQLMGGACGVAGRWVALYYTGGTQPTLAHGIGTFAGIGCNLACKEWACDDIPDCQLVKKCDTHCETISTNGDSLNVNTGQVIYQ